MSNIELSAQEHTANLDIDNIYTKLWKSLIQPERLTYYADDLRPEFYNSPNGETFKRFDFEAETVLKDSLAVSLFLPFNKNTNTVKRKTDVVVYMHTHNGMRMQGLNILIPIMNLGFGVCLFDFHGNGMSSGKYVTFGWTEVLDLDSVSIRRESKNGLI
jgi:hypothetical protein